MARTMFAKIPMGYGGKQVDRGEIVELKNLPNDDRLIGLRYFLPYEPKVHSKYVCLDCSRAFVTESHLTGHKQKRGGCFGDSPEPTKAETAELLGVEPDKVVVN